MLFALDALLSFSLAHHDACYKDSVWEPIWSTPPRTKGGTGTTWNKDITDTVGLLLTVRSASTCRSYTYVNHSKQFVQADVCGVFQTFTLSAQGCLKWIKRSLQSVVQFGWTQAAMMLPQQTQLQRCQQHQNQQQQQLVLRPEAARVPAKAPLVAHSSTPRVSSSRLQQQRGQAQVVCSLRRHDEVHTGDWQQHQRLDDCQHAVIFIKLIDSCVGYRVGYRPACTTQSQNCPSPFPGILYAWGCLARAAWQRTLCSC